MRIMHVNKRNRGSYNSKFHGKQSCLGLILTADWSSFQEFATKSHL